MIRCVIDWIAMNRMVKIIGLNEIIIIKKKFNKVESKSMTKNSTFIMNYQQLESFMNRLEDKLKAARLTNKILLRIKLKKEVFFLNRSCCWWNGTIDVLKYWSWRLTVIVRINAKIAERRPKTIRTFNNHYYSKQNPDDESVTAQQTKSHEPNEVQMNISVCFILWVCMFCRSSATRHAKVQKSHIKVGFIQQNSSCLGLLSFVLVLSYSMTLIIQCVRCSAVQRFLWMLKTDANER